ncbi:fungal-specific transcription factor domain-containing protein [Lineolata rhizophorae]|uniref:Fungal-specific transcription factor domain-containing protein n=1 Tax=Lineolata rhizophorae TaxID=578093 RepID=A0A6A6NP05_9PEZI|nr:fungal-specific transcription factor domain-containing protein [Lineolata rhizophorae]
MIGRPAAPILAALGVEMPNTQGARAYSGSSQNDETSLARLGTAQLHVAAPSRTVTAMNGVRLSDGDGRVGRVHQPLSTAPMPGNDAVKPGVGAAVPAAGTENGWSSSDDQDDDADGYDEQPPSKKIKIPRPKTVSCETCKKRKVKCDRGQPSCGWCTRNGQECEYTARKKPGLRAGYGRELEARMGDNEYRTHLHGTRLDSLEDYVRKFDVFEARVNEVSARNEDLSQKLKQAEQRALNAHLPSNDQSSFQSRSFIPDTDPQLAPSSLDWERDLPPLNMCINLTHNFFSYINIWYPILHQQNTLDSFFSHPLKEEDKVLLCAIVATSLRLEPTLAADIRNQYYAAAKDRVLKYAFDLDTGRGAEKRTVRVLQALVILALDIVGTSNGLPAWNILAIITRSAVQLGLAVETIGSSMDRFPTVSLQRVRVLPPTWDWTEIESHRRLFWTIYLLDRFATVSSAFDFALDEKYIERRLPCADEYFQSSRMVETPCMKGNKRKDDDPTLLKNVDWFAHYIEVMGLVSRVHKFVKRPVDISTEFDVKLWKKEFQALASETEALENNFPDDCKPILVSRGDPVNMNSGIVTLCAVYQYAIIRLHSIQAYPANTSRYFKRSAASLASIHKCRTAAIAICKLNKLVREHVSTTSNRPLISFGPPFAFTLWVAARVLLIHSSEVPADYHLIDRVPPLIASLAEHGALWNASRRFADMLGRILHDLREYRAAGTSPLSAAKDAKGGGGAAGAGGSGAPVKFPRSIKTLRDMRRCAYEVSMLMEAMPQAGTDSPRTAALDLEGPWRMRREWGATTAGGRGSAAASSGPSEASVARGMANGHHRRPAASSMAPLPAAGAPGLATLAGAGVASAASMGLNGGDYGSVLPTSPGSPYHGGRGFYDNGDSTVANSGDHMVVDEGFATRENVYQTLNFSWHPQGAALAGAPDIGPARDLTGHDAGVSEVDLYYDNVALSAVGPDMLPGDEGDYHNGIGVEDGGVRTWV